MVEEAGAELVDNMGHNYRVEEGTYEACFVHQRFHILELGQAE